MASPVDRIPTLDGGTIVVHAGSASLRPCVGFEVDGRMHWLSKDQSSMLEQALRNARILSVDLLTRPVAAR